MTKLVLFVVIAVGVSFLCSLLESAFLSITPGFVAAARNRKAAYAETLSRLKANAPETLSAILILNTLANTVGATGAGAQALQIFGQAWIAVFMGGLTLTILIVSEIVPKSLGSAYWRRLVPFVVRVLSPMVVVLKPAVVVTSWITDWLTRDAGKTTISREELRAVGQLGFDAKVIDEGEFTILEGLWKFSKVEVDAVMTPRDVVFALPDGLTLGEAVKRSAGHPFSRIPVHPQGVDEISSYVLRDELLLAEIRDDPSDSVAGILRPILVVTEQTGLREVLETMVGRNEHIAAVVDEEGRTTGVISLEDALETLLGFEIRDETDEVEDLRAWAEAKRQERTERTEPEEG